MKQYVVGFLFADHDQQVVLIRKLRPEWQAGKLNGVELAREARRRRPALAVLYASAYPANVLINQGRLESGADLVEKPYRKDDLAARLAAALAPRSIAERIDA